MCFDVVGSRNAVVVVLDPRDPGFLCGSSSLHDDPAAGVVVWCVG